MLESSDYKDYDAQIMPSDPQIGESWLAEDDLQQVKSWIAGLGHRSAYVVVSRSMKASVGYYGAPKGYNELVSAIPTVLHGTVVYGNSDATVYRLTIDGNDATQLVADGAGTAGA